MNAFEDHITERRRLAILRELRQANLYTMDAATLRRRLQASGHAVSHDRLSTDLAWLVEQDCLIMQQAGDVAVATMTLRGEEAAQGLVSIPGIARPRPDELG